MAKLVDVYRPSKPLSRRQLPLVVDETLTVIIKQINAHGLYTFPISMPQRIMRYISYKSFSI